MVYFSCWFRWIVGFAGCVVRLVSGVVVADCLVITGVLVLFAVFWVWAWLFGLGLGMWLFCALVFYWLYCFGFGVC